MVSWALQGKAQSKHQSGLIIQRQEEGFTLGKVGKRKKTYVKVLPSYVKERKLNLLSSKPVFWHQGPVLWKTIFQQTRGTENSSQDDSHKEFII